MIETRLIWIYETVMDICGIIQIVLYDEVKLVAKYWLNLRFIALNGVLLQYILFVKASLKTWRFMNVMRKTITHILLTKNGSSIIPYSTPAMK